MKSCKIENIVCCVCKCRVYLENCSCFAGSLLKQDGVLANIYGKQQDTLEVQNTVHLKLDWHKKVQTHL